MVRINQLPEGLGDIKYIAQHYVNLILIPKCETAEQIKMVEDEIEVVAPGGTRVYEILSVKYK